MDHLIRTSFFFFFLPIKVLETGLHKSRVGHPESRVQYGCCLVHMQISDCYARGSVCRELEPEGLSGSLPVRWLFRARCKILQSMKWMKVTGKKMSQQPAVGGSNSYYHCLHHPVVNHKDLNHFHLHDLSFFLFSLFLPKSGCEKSSVWCLGLN